MKREISRSHYFQRMFIFDLFGSLPLSYLLLWLESSPETRAWIRILRLLKFYRLYEIITILWKHSQINKQLLKISGYFFVFPALVHIFSCILAAISMWEIDRGNRFDGKSLLPYLGTAAWRRDPPVADWSTWRIYVNCLNLSACYMAIGPFGDIIPFTILEETFGVF
jgi:hypothetical protein